MATGNNTTSQAYHLTIDESPYVEYTVNHPRGCAWVSCRQLASESQVIWRVKHRSDDVGEDYEAVPAGAEWRKGDIHAQLGVGHRFSPGDTIGFFLRDSSTGNIILVFVEHEV